MEQPLEQIIWQRARNTCEYCQMRADLHPAHFEVDHIRPRKLHGATVSENLALACFWCNSYKGSNIAGHDPDTAEITRLFHPRLDSWPEHFGWNGPMLVGRTAIGRTTIDVLRINDPTYIQLRAELIDEGVFPPSAPAIGR